MDEPRRHYARSNEIDTDIKIPHNLTYIWNLKYIKKANAYSENGTVFIMSRKGKEIEEIVQRVKIIII